MRLHRWLAPIFTSPSFSQWLSSPCLLCQHPSVRALCDACLTSLPQMNASCIRCALPLHDDNTICGACLSKPPSFDSAMIPWPYEYPIAELVKRFKVGDLACGHALTETLLARVKSSTPSVDMICPVPLHWRRQLWRGFNQAAFMAAQISRALNLPAHPCLQRHQATSKQQYLNRRERLKNLRHAFRPHPKHLAQIANASIALVDDVVTTQATVEILASQLKKAGAKQVHIWALARTPAPA